MSLALQKHNEIPPRAESEFKELRSPVYLRSNIDRGFGRFIEKYIFCKTDFFKNNPRANFLLVRAFLMTTAIFILLFIATLAICSVIRLISLHLGTPDINYDLFTHPILSSRILKGTLAYFGVVSAIFWRPSDLFRQQWQYCSALYNEMLKVEGERRADLRASLMADILLVDLWAHRSFADAFAYELSVALYAKYKDEPGNYGDMVKKIDSKEFTEKQAADLIDWFQDKVLNDPLLTNRNKIGTPT